MVMQSGENGGIICYHAVKFQLVFFLPRLLRLCPEKLFSLSIRFHPVLWNLFYIETEAIWEISSSDLLSS